jgi:hypothetical protein
LALTLNNRTRRCTQLIRSSMVASRFGISRSIALASAGKPNSMVAEIRDGVVSGEAASALKAGFSAAATEPGSTARELSSKPT